MRSQVRDRPGNALACRRPAREIRGAGVSFHFRAVTRARILVVPPAMVLGLLAHAPARTRGRTRRG